MARAMKKESALTPEEKLAQALVPEEEQPYKIPDTWCWVKFGSIIELISGRDAALADCNDKGIGTPYILGASSIDGNSFIIERWIQKPQVLSRRGDILLSVKGTVGKLYIQKEDNINLSRQIMAIRPGIALNRVFAYFYLQFICDDLKEVSNGLIPGISRTDILEKPCPLPPFEDQKRIVDRIESLFSKLDEAKEKAQAVVDGCEDRKAAILHKAFTGELTKEWRKSRGFECTIKNQSLNKLCTKITDGFHNSPKPVEAGYPYVMAANVQETGIDYYNGMFMDEKNHRELYKKTHPEKGDILVVNIGASTGRAAIIETDIEFSFKNCAILKVDKSQLNPKYLLFYIWLRKNYWLKEVTRGGAQPFLSLKMLNQIEIPTVRLQEQEQVVKIANQLLKHERQARDMAEQVICQIDSMKKSILAKAFRGELSTNDPTDESAEELLKRML